jgi:hypothetical protein
VRCLFCKEPSAVSRSREHVIPESLGNRTLVLPAGVVCDACNNYFSRKVEKPFLDNPTIRHLRYSEAVPTKRGSVPTLRAFVAGGGAATLARTCQHQPPSVMFDEPADVFRLLKQGRGLLLSEESAIPPSATQISRFIAKVAMEYMAAQLLQVDGGIDYLVDESNLDVLRNHARRGTHPRWPTSARRIYPAYALWEEDGSPVQRVWEACVFQDTDGYQYFVLALFGLEFAIHIGSPDIAGYLHWLITHGGRSPLFPGKVDDELLAQAVARGRAERRPDRALLGCRAT